MNVGYIVSIEGKVYQGYTFPNKPEDFHERSYTARKEWVLNEMAHGDFEREKSLGAKDVIFYCCVYGSDAYPLHFMFRALLQRFDPEKVVKHLTIDWHAKSFIEVFGVSAFSLIPPDLAKKVKSKLLEDALGL
jgi:hypothetical protein